MAEKWDSALYDDRHSFVWKYGSDLVALLAPASGERVLDLGCGTGHLTAKIAEAGADVVGLDSSASMVAQARQNFPKLKFQLGDARDFHTEVKFDAVFSNAALHWVPEAEAAVRSIAGALKPGGRLVLEMGAKGNTLRVMEAVEAVLREAGYPALHAWYFPSVAEYSALLEKHGFEIVMAQTFPRWTRLEHPERGMREWLEMFGGAYFSGIPEPERNRLVRAIEERLRPALCCDGAWWVDYRRLRVIAAAASMPPRTQSGMPIPR
jgi:trans-aconitate methyltransferase